MVYEEMILKQKGAILREEGSMAILIEVKGRLV